MAPQAKAKPIKFEPTEYVIVISQADADWCGVKAGDVFGGAKVIVSDPFGEDYGAPQ